MRFLLIILSCISLGGAGVLIFLYETSTPDYCVAPKYVGTQAMCDEIHEQVILYPFWSELKERY